MGNLLPDVEGPDFEGLPIDRHVGERLRRLRVSRNLEVDFIARSLEVPETLVTAWEEGVYRIPACQLVALTALFVCPVIAFFEGMEGLDLEHSEMLKDNPWLTGHLNGKH